MAVNFCVESVGTLIESDNLCADGYEVENLISPAKRGRGFMAEYFIKPPVSVLVTLPCPAELSCVAVGLVRGSVRLTGFEIWAARDGDDFVLIGKKFNATGDVVRFHNRCYAPRGPFALLNDGPSARGDVKREETLKHFYCKHVSRVKLRLVRTTGSSSVGLGFLEIWGQSMAALCNPAAQNELIRKSRAALSTVPGFTETPTPYFAPRAEAAPVGERSPPQEPSSTRAQSLSIGSDSPEFHIPADFQDALTFELMTQPVLLPSGQVVDQSTLDKHVEMEQRWGRVATDPFTGTPLTGGDASRPKSLPELKSRIDHFVVRNLDRLGNIPRALGAAPLETAGGTRVSALALLPLQPAQTVQNDGTRSASRTSGYCHKPCHSAAASREPSKHGSNSFCLGAEPGKEVSASKTCTSAIGLHEAASVAAPLRDATKHGTSSCSASSGEKRKLAYTSDGAVSKQSRPNPGSHEQRLADSLSSSLAEVLQRIRRVGAPKADDGFSGALCFACNTAWPTHRVPCNHIVCQACLKDSVQRGQCSCGKTFRSSEVVRVHVVH